MKENKIVLEALIGHTDETSGSPETFYSLIRINGKKQKFLAIAEVGSTETRLIEAKDIDDAQGLMIDYIGNSLGLPTRHSFKEKIL